MSRIIKKRRNAYYVSAIVFVAFLFSYYFFAYIPAREKEMNERGIRVMNRMIKNISEREQHYERSLALFECDYLVKGFLENYDDSEEALALFKDVFNKVECENLKDEVIQIADSIARYNGSEVYMYYVRDAIQEYVSKNVNADPAVVLARVEDHGSFMYTDTIRVDSNRVYGLGITAENLISEVKRYEFFTDIFVTLPDNDDAVFDESRLGFNYFNYHPSVESGTAEDSLLNGLEYDEGLGLYKIPNVDIVRRRIGGEDYYCFTSNLIVQGYPYYLTGILEVDEYNSMVRSVSIWVVMISIVFLLFLIQILPIIKPFVLTSKERLVGSDVIWAALALIFGVSAFTLFVIGIDTFKVEEEGLVDEKLSIYSKRIENAFNKEIEKGIEYIKNADAFYREENYVDRKMLLNTPPEARFLRIDGLGFAQYYSLSTNSVKNRYGVSINHLSQSLNLSHRGYYKALAKPPYEKAWKTNNGEPYIVESLFSLSEGKYETVIALRESETPRILASVYPLKAVNNAYLEPDFTYTIVDEYGNIQYHSDQSKIKNENILEEADDDEKLASYLRNSSVSNLPITVSLKDYRAHVRPVLGTPWHIITLYDIKKSRLTITTSMTITFQVLLLLLAYLFLLHTFFRISYSSQLKQKKVGFSYLFLSPINTSPRVYLLLLGVNLIGAVILVGIYKTNHLDLIHNLVAYLGLISALILYTYGVLIKYSFNQNGALNRIKRQRISFFEITVLAFVAIWLVLQLANFNNEGSNLSNSISKVNIAMQIMLVISYAIIKTQKGFSDWLSSQSSKISFNYYYMHGFTWVLILGFLPAMLFFKPVYNAQHINRSLSNWVEEVEIINHDGKSKHYKANQFSSDTASKSIEITTAALKSAIAKIDLISPYFSEDGNQLRGLHAVEGFEIATEIREDRDSHLPYFLLKPTLHPMHFVDINAPEPNSLVAFALPRFSTNNMAAAMVFWLTIGLMFIILFVSIIRLSQKFFYLDLLHHLRAIKIKRAIGSTSLKEDLETLKSEELPNIMLVGPPYSGRNGMANAILGNSKDRKYLDFINDLNKEKEKLTDTLLNSPIIINNFDHQLFDFEHNKEKLAILEQIMRYRNEFQLRTKLILISTLGTGQLMSIYKEKIKDLKTQGSDKEEQINVLEQTVRRWETVLYGFTKQIVPIKPNTEEIIALNEVEKDSWIENELNHGNSLAHLKPQIYLFKARLAKKSSLLNDDEVTERLIDAIMNIAQNYYFALWSSCTKEQRFLLYDMAEDGLVNSKNDRIIYELVRRGILETDPSLHIFNESFARFVLENISEEEGTEMEKEAKKEGSWGSYRMLVIALILIIIIFLSFVERDAIAKITGIITLTGALLPKLVGLFSKIGTSAGSIIKKPAS